MELNLSTTIKCTEETKDTWQFVYTSQLYGTFFAVYAKVNADSSKKHIDKIALKIVNYKGPINIVIHSAMYDSQRTNYSIQDPIDGHTKNIKIISISLWLTGLIGHSETQKPVEVSCDLGEEITFLEINRKLLPLSQHCNSVVDGVFDTEFYYRDGLNSVINKDISKIDGLTSWDEYNNQSTNNESLMGPGGICPRGYAKITF